MTRTFQKSAGTTRIHRRHRTSREHAAGAVELLRFLSRHCVPVGARPRLLRRQTSRILRLRPPDALPSAYFSIPVPFCSKVGRFSSIFVETCCEPTICRGVWRRPSSSSPFRWAKPFLQPLLARLRRVPVAWHLFELSICHLLLSSCCSASTAVSDPGQTASSGRSGLERSVFCEIRRISPYLLLAWPSSPTNSPHLTL